MRDADMNVIYQILSKHDNPHNFSGTPATDAMDLRKAFASYYDAKEKELAVEGSTSTSTVD